VLGTDDLAARRRCHGGTGEPRPLVCRLLPAERASSSTRPGVRGARFETSFHYAPDHRAALSYDAATLLGQVPPGPRVATARDPGMAFRRRRTRARPSGARGRDWTVRFTADRNAEEKRILIGRVAP
jgi:hypothetical protein